MTRKVGSLNRKTGLPWTLEQMNVDSTLRHKKSRERNPEKYKIKSRVGSRLYRLLNPERCKESARKLYEKNAEKIRAYNKIFGQRQRKEIGYSEKARERHYAYRKREKVKTNCRNRTLYAIEHGILVRPKNCPSCLKTCKVQAHHEDYTKHLEVRWLCRDCHMSEHRKYK